MSHFINPHDRELHVMMNAINRHHFEANPTLPTEEYLARHRAARDRLIAKLKEQGKQVILVKADHLEACGRYVCEGDDGFSGYDPLAGTTTTEQEV
jgi:hypothetical protein